MTHSLLLQGGLAQFGRLPLLREITQIAEGGTLLDIHNCATPLLIVNLLSEINQACTLMKCRLGSRKVKFIKNLSLECSFRSEMAVGNRSSTTQKNKNRLDSEYLTCVLIFDIDF